MFWFFGPKAFGILARQPGIEPAPPALEGEVLTTGLPGKSLDILIIILSIHEHGISFHLCLLQLLSSMSYSFQYMVTPLVKFIPK